MAIVINPNAIQKGSITKEMLTQGVRKPIILTSSTTEVDEETYQKLLSDDVDVVFKYGLYFLRLAKISRNASGIELTFIGRNPSNPDIVDDIMVVTYNVSIAKSSPHSVSHEELVSNLGSLIGSSGYLSQRILSSALQKIDLTGTDAKRKAKLDKFEADWKALTGADDLNGARFVGVTDDENTPPTKCVFTFDPNNNAYWGLSAGSEDDDVVRKIYVDCINGTIYITPLFSHLEPVEIFTDNSAASKQKNIDNLNAYKSNLTELGVDTNKSFQVPFREGDNATFIGTLQYSVDTNIYIGVGCASDEDTARIIRISSTGESTITTLARADNLSRILRDFGMYPELEPVPLNSEVTGKYINSDGKYVDASDWNIASIGAVSLGNTYLLNMVSSANMVLGVALFVSRVYKRDKEGNIIGTTLTPLFSAKNTSIPASGYVLFEAMDDYDEVLVCYKPALTTQVLVARWGFKASHATQLRNLRLIVDNKTDFEGIYELLTAGYALNLVGKGNGEPQAFMSRKTGGGNITDGSAVIKEVDGVQPIVWNQLVKSPSQSPLNYMGSNISISGDTVTFRAEATGTGAFFYPLVIVGGHKYFCSVHIKTTSLTNRIRLVSNQFTGKFVYCNETTEWQKIESLGTAPASVKNAQLSVYDQRESNWDDVQMKNLMVVDLTQMFGAGNEPSTYEEYLNRISYYHIKDAYAYNAGEVVNYKGTGIRTTNIDGTKTYIRDWSEVMMKYFPDGMTSLNGVKDFFNDKKAVRKWGCKVFDGTELFERYVSDSNLAILYTDILSEVRKVKAANVVSALYTTTGGSWITMHSDKMICGYPDTGRIAFRDDIYTSTDAWKSHLAELYAAGTPLVVYYELAEPVEDIFEKPLNLTYTVINGGTETSLATENSTQFEGSIFYGKDYVGVIDELQLQNRVTQIEFENWEN